MIAVVVLVVAALGVLVISHERAAAAMRAAQSYEVNGQRFPCGTSGRVRPEASVQYPDPGASFTLDGQPQPATLDAPGVTLTMVVTPTYMCSDHKPHHIHVNPGQSTRPRFVTGCGIDVIPAVLHPKGYNGSDVPADLPGQVTDQCDLTWTD